MGSRFMKAVVKAPQGRGIEVVDEPYPELKPGYVIVKIKAAGICGTDLHTYEKMNHPQSQTALLRPLGHEGSGEIVEVGMGVEGFEVGDRVTYNPFVPRDRGFCDSCEYCLTGNPLGCSKRHLTSLGGTMAEYTAIRGDALYRLPDNLTYEEGALAEPFAVGLAAVHEVVQFRAGQSAAILGSGPIGLCTLLAVKLASPSLTVVTGLSVDRTPRMALARRFGADVTVNVDEEDPVKRVMEVTEGLGVDAVFEAVGIPLVQQGLRMLKFRGKFVGIGHPAWSEAAEHAAIPFTVADYLNMQHRRLTLAGHWIYDTSTWVMMMKLLETGRVDLKPLATHRLPLTEAETGFQLAFRRECIKVLLVP
jgi:L-iditol 2-dehydrogenase